jgi:hypothetical protein
MTAIRYARLIAAVTFAMSVVACGSGDDAPPPPPPDQSVGNYLQALPSWEQFSPAAPDEAPDPKPGTTPEKTPSASTSCCPDGVIESQQYACLTTEFSMKSTPEKIVMFSPDRELLWPGALIQGKSTSRWRGLAARTADPRACADQGVDPLAGHR